MYQYCRIKQMCSDAHSITLRGKMNICLKKLESRFAENCDNV